MGHSTGGADRFVTGSIIAAWPTIYFGPDWSDATG